MKEYPPVKQEPKNFYSFMAFLIEKELICWFLFAALGIVVTLHVNGIDVIPRFITSAHAVESPKP